MNKKKLMIYGIVIAIALAFGFTQMNKAESDGIYFSELFGQWVGSGTVATQEASGKVRVTIEKEKIVLADSNIPITSEFKIESIKARKIEPGGNLGHKDGAIFQLSTDGGEVSILYRKNGQVDYIELTFYEDGQETKLPLVRYEEEEE